ncbi:ArdC family protein [Hydromonas duriensis]|uniref:Antirestriction protein ArdC n=1 Tax=Hydromonas duriensis TaxID=1527608 RepID=A0A4R6Y1D7_9BURK|nr:zincin-like metallopeptidase domain-containing protein [Hydromonas duriensis]TDR30231.1 antirestriction protein ArdC [Hydromonas duriensis]
MTTTKHMAQAVKRDIHQEVTDQIIAMLEDCGEYEQAWVNPFPTFRPQNPISGNVYRGVNVLILGAAALRKRYPVNLWMTFKQALENGTPVKPGERSTYVVRYGVYDKTIESEDDVDTSETLTEMKMFLKYYPVFNVSQLDGYVIPEIQTQGTGFLEGIDAAERLLNDSGANWVEQKGNVAFYSPEKDCITLPMRSQFKSAEGFYSVALHELVHWTGHSSRLNRNFTRMRFGNHNYAFEELVAEIGAAFLCGAIGIEAKTLPNHAAYIKSWLEVLRNDKKAIFTAAAQAQKAFDLLTESAVSLNSKAA